jgi:hypothetical protein
MHRALLAALLLASASTVAAQTCTLEYQRADNMWAAAGRADGPLGKETLTLQAGQTKVFTTDWKYEKRRNDGTNYYGSHTRIVTNTGKRPLKLVFHGDIPGLMASLKGLIKQTGSERGEGSLNPGMSWNVRADLQEVSCPPADKEAKSDTTPPGGVANPPSIDPPAALTARQASPREIVLTWERVPSAREYRVYVEPPPQPHLAGRPAIVGGNGSRFVIVMPPSLPPATVYHASIEAVGTNGAVSRRVAFPAVMVQSSAGGSPAGGQRCPPGQFVTGIDAGGKILCAAP